MAEEKFTEENLARLIRAGYSSAARTVPAVREQTWQRLAAELSQRHPAAFPDAILAILAGIVTLLAGWLFAQTLTGVAMPITIPPDLVPVVILIVAINLFAVPITGIIIVIRSQR